MTARRALGYAMLSTPFAGLFAFVAYTLGLLMAAAIFVAVGATLVFISIGIELAE